MEIYVKIIVVLIALLHIYFLWLEMFAWTTKGPKVFKNYPREFFEHSKALAANQGLYNGFLAAGLIWSVLIPVAPWSFYIAIFFLTCILVAGTYGAVTASVKIFYIQGLPALIGLILLHL